MRCRPFMNMSLTSVEINSKYVSSELKGASLRRVPYLAVTGHRRASRRQLILKDAASRGVMRRNPQAARAVVFVKVIHPTGPGHLRRHVVTLAASDRSTPVFSFVFGLPLFCFYLFICLLFFFYLLLSPEATWSNHGAANHLQSELDAVGHQRARGDLRQIYPAGPSSARWPAKRPSNSARAHQSGRRHGLDQVVGDQRIHRPHAGVMSRMAMVEPVSTIFCKSRLPSSSARGANRAFR